jgi:hypothetical protein
MDISLKPEFRTQSPHVRVWPQSNTVQEVLVLRELDIRCFAYTRFYPKEVFLHRLQKVACARWVTDLLFAF